VAASFVHSFVRPSSQPAAWAWGTNHDSHYAKAFMSNAAISGALLCCGRSSFTCKKLFLELLIEGNFLSQTQQQQHTLNNVLKIARKEISILALHTK